jgi:predicted ABC-type ATPase
MLKPTKDVTTFGSKLVIGQEADGKFFWKLVMQNGQEHSRKSGFLNQEDAINNYIKTEYAKGGLVKKKCKGDGVEETCEIFDSKGERAIDDKSIEKLTRCVTALPQTKSSNINTNGSYTREREGLHKKIIDKFKKDVVCIEKGRPIAVLMGGSPASGKSTFLKKYRPYLLSDSLFKVDADEIRAELPEYKGWNASQTHEETGDIVDTLISDRNVGIPCKFDFVFDGTMSSVRRYKILINNLRKEGYDIFIVFMGNIPKEEIKERALERYKKSGRFVPMFVIDYFYATGEKYLNELNSLFDGYLVYNKLFSSLAVEATAGYSSQKFQR